MARTNALSEREVGICSRLREFRTATSLSRIAFAQKAGIDSSVLVRYEHARVPLKYIHAWRLIRVFLINPDWLASGEGPQWTRAARLTPGPEAIESPEGALFSAVYDKLLCRPAVKAPVEKTAEQLSPGELRFHHEFGFMLWLRGRLNELPDRSVADFIERLKASGNVLLKKFPKDSPHVVKQRKAHSEEDIDTELRLRLQGTI